MKKEKQLLLIECLSQGRYKVIDDKLFYKERVTNKWKEFIGNKLKSGYVQCILFLKRPYGEGQRIVCYKHIIIYVANYGQYKEGLKIDHLDRNNQNNHPLNLKAKTDKENVLNSSLRGDYAKSRLTQEEKSFIGKSLLNNVSQNKIAKALGRNRITILRYAKSLK